MTAPKQLAQLARQSGHRTLAEQAFASLHDAIVTGLLEPGERLPIEGLADVLEMSPMPIREALRRLDAAGMVENVPHRGARVTELSIQDLHEVYQARLLLEPLAMRESAKRFSAADAEVASRALEQLREAVSQGRLEDAWPVHTDFHFALYEPAGSRWLIRLIKPLWETSERYRHASGLIEWRLDARQREHDRMLAAVVDHDSELAAVEIHNHLVQSANHVAEQMGGDALFPLKSTPKDGSRKKAKSGKGRKKAVKAAG